MLLREKSIQIIKENQANNGAFVASPNFKNYKFCWLRDGSFIAFAMDLAGEYQSAEEFFNWVNRTVKRYSYKVETLLTKKQKGETIDPREFLPTRYTMNGLEAGDDWTNFQLDGYGTWLWALAVHIKITERNELLFEFSESIKTTISYLTTFWDTPNFDCWEEFGDKIHTATLACIFGGLKSINYYLQEREIDDCLASISGFIKENCIINSHLTKYVGTDNIDASLLWACLPFDLFRYDDEIMKNTVREIETQLLHGGGVHRYPEDNYYGGGEWLLLSSWLGWYYCKVGKIDDASHILNWVESHADNNGNMPEQVVEHPNNESYIEQWVERWGQIAKPLLWSHAMYLVLLTEIEANI